MAQLLMNVEIRGVEWQRRAKIFHLQLKQKMAHEVCFQRKLFRSVIQRQSKVVSQSKGLRFKSGSGTHGDQARRCF